MSNCNNNTNIADIQALTSGLRRDAGLLHEVVHSNSNEITVDTGKRKTLKGLTEYLLKVIAENGYKPPVEYVSGLSVSESNFTVIHDGVVYAPRTDLLPFTTSEPFNPSQWLTLQGLTSIRLGMEDGAALVGYGPTTVFEALGDVYGRLDLNSKQDVLYARFLRKLRVDGGAVINCVGTSNTSKNGNHVSYPEALQEVLNDVYANSITVNNLGISGGTVASNFNKWKDNTPTADLTIMEFTANDQAKTEIGQFVLDLRNYIEYELNNGRAVMLMTAPKMSATINLRRDVYSAAMYSVASSYGINIIDAEINLKNYSESVYYDGTHTNSLGGTVAGYKVAATLIGEGIHNPCVVTNGSTLLGRPTVDSIVFGPNVRQYNDSTLPAVTPNEINKTYGISANFSGSEGVSYAYYSFYANTDNLVILPNFRIYDGATVEFTLDGGGISPSYTIGDSPLSGGKRLRVSTTNTYQYANTEKTTLTNNFENRVMQPIPVVTSGWHILKIKVTGNTLVLRGLEFYTPITIRRRRSFILKTVGSRTDPVSISETFVPFSDVEDAFDITLPPIEAYQNPIFKFAWADANVIYSFLVKSNNLNLGDWYLASEITYHRKDSGFETSSRLLDGVSTTNDGIILKWRANLMRHGSLTVTIL